MNPIEMKKIVIKRSYDQSECDTCGTTWSDGAVVTIDGVIVLNEPACAWCQGPTNVSDLDILDAICNHLGYEVIEE